MVNVLAIQLDEATAAVLRERETEGLRLISLPRPEQGLATLEKAHEPLDVVLLGAQLEAPVQMAQRTHALDPQLAVVILSEPERYPSVNRAIQFAPLLGEHVWCHSLVERAELPASLRELAERTRQRREYQRTVAALNEKLASGRRAPVPSPDADYLGRLLETAPVGIIALDGNAVVLACNQKASELLERSERAAMGTSLPGLFPESERPLWEILTARSASDPGTSREVLERPRLDGTVQQVEISLSPLTGRTGERGFLAILQDVTERVRLLRELHEAIRTRDEFLTLASHELKTPLTVLQLQAQTLRSATRRAERALSLERLAALAASLERSVGRLSQRVEELLDFSQRGIDKRDLDLEDVDLTEVVRQVADRMADDAARAGCALSVEALGPVVGRWDRRRLEQALRCLLSNAFKFGASQPVTVRVEADARTAWISIQDEGIGISPENQARIFERFERAVSSVHYGGFGLGLWIVRHTAEALGGKVRVESQLGAGATFTMELPRAGVETPPLA